MTWLAPGLAPVAPSLSKVGVFDQDLWVGHGPMNQPKSNKMQDNVYLLLDSLSHPDLSPKLNIKSLAQLWSVPRATP